MATTRYTVTVRGNVWHGVVENRTAKFAVTAESDADAAGSALAQAERLGWGGPAVLRVEPA